MSLIAQVKKKPKGGVAFNVAESAAPGGNAGNAVPRMCTCQGYPPTYPRTHLDSYQGQNQYAAGTGYSQAMPNPQQPMHAPRCQCRPPNNQRTPQ